MSFLTTFLETTPHFENAVAQKEQELKTIQPQSEERLKTLVDLAYCYAHVQLQNGITAAEEAIAFAGMLNNQRMKANALCAKAMNEFRIGFIAKAQTTAKQALSIFENINDKEGKCDAYFHLGAMPYVSKGPADTAFYLTKACTGYATFGNTTGVYLVRIQQTLQLFLSSKFEEGTSEIKKIMAALSAPGHRHLLCFAHMQLAISMHLRQDVAQFIQALLEWQKLAEANGNFHDYAMTKAMIVDCYRLQHADENAMQACLESIQCTDKLGSIHGHSTVAIIMATICIAQEQYTDALLYIQKSVVATLEIEDEYKYLMSLNIMGETYLKLGQINKARETFETVQREAKLHDDRLNLVAAQRHLAELAYEQGQFDKALFDFKILFDSANNSDNWNIQDNGNYAFSIAKASDTAMRKAALKPEDRNTLRLYYLERYLQLAQKQQIEREEVKALNSLAEYYEEVNDLVMSIQFHKKYIQLYKKIVNEESIKSITSLRLKYEAEKKEQEILLLKKESDQALLNERVRISRELHDDIGSTLGSISIYSEVAKSRAEKKENPEEVLAKIGATSRELINKMSDIVWSLQPNNESFKQLQNRMLAFAGMILAPRDINYEFVQNDEMKNKQMTAEQCKNIFLIFKETVYNITKYAECKMVNIALSVESDIFEMIIRDDGKGFDINMNNSYNCNGIKNMKARAGEINGRLNIISGKCTGTSVELIARI